MSSLFIYRSSDYLFNQSRLMGAGVRLEFRVAQEIFSHGGMSM